MIRRIERVSLKKIALWYEKRRWGEACSAGNDD